MRRVPSIMLVVALLVTGAAVSAAPGARATHASEAIVKVAYNKKLRRKIVVDGRGITLYMYVVDKSGKSACTADTDSLCARVWPPLKSDAPARSGRGIRTEKLGLTMRSDGISQVTYNNHPLYYFAGFGSTRGDRRPGQIRGQKFVGLWYVLSPLGRPIKR